VHEDGLFLNVGPKLSVAFASYDKLIAGRNQSFDGKL